MTNGNLVAVGLNLCGQIIDSAVSSDHAFGKVEIGIQESLSRSIHGRADQTCHLDQIVADAVELLVENLAHVSTPDGRG